MRPRRRDPAEINLTPLIDVVFLLLIFFMVSTTFKDESRLRVQLPQAQGESVSAAELDLIRILIDRSGALFLQEQPLPDSATLVQALTALRGAHRPPPLLIEADAQTPHEAVMGALDAAGQSGFVQIAFATTRRARAIDADEIAPVTGPVTGSAAAPDRPADADANRPQGARENRLEEMLE
nr:biopolymer transporter ExbD [Thiocapsa imhoffii]